MGVGGLGAGIGQAVFDGIEDQMLVLGDRLWSVPDFIDTDLGCQVG